MAGRESGGSGMGRKRVESEKQHKSQTNVNTEGTKKREGAAKEMKENREKSKRINQESRSSKKTDRTCYWICCVAPREGGEGLKRSPRI